MKIIAVHRGFACDHSSTSYEFLAVDKPLGQKARRDVSALSSRANPTQRRVSFIYHADGYDIPGGWERLMREYYDVMYSESYDWWTFAMAFDAPKKQQKTLMQYEFAGIDDLGVSVSCDDRRVTVAIHCRLDTDSLYWLGERYDGDGFDFDEENEEAEDDERLGNAMFEWQYGLLDLLTRVRRQLTDSDCRSLYAVWEIYGHEDEEFGPPLPPDKNEGRDIVDEFRALLATE